jgi:parvulin-like peptidyl-prolyl isomerase
MKRLAIFAVTTLIASLGLAAAPARIDGVAAYVNAHVITVSDVLKTSRALQEQLSRGGEDSATLNKAYLAALDEVVARKLIVDDYENQKEIKIPDAMIEERVEGVISDMFNGDRSDLLSALSRDGMSEESWRTQIREQIVVSAMRNLRVDSKVDVSPLAVRKLYEEKRESYATQPKVKLRMIVIAKGDGEAKQAIQQAKVDELLQALKDGGDFAELARSVSEDSRAADGGARGWMERDMLREDLAKVAFTVGVGQVSDAIDIGKQFCILKVEDRVDAEIVPFDDVQPNIERELRQSQSRDLYDVWITRLRDDAYVKILDESPF